MSESETLTFGMINIYSMVKIGILGTLTAIEGVEGLKITRIAMLHSMDPGFKVTKQSSATDSTLSTAVSLGSSVKSYMSGDRIQTQHQQLSLDLLQEKREAAVREKKEADKRLLSQWKARPRASQLGGPYASGEVTVYAEAKTVPGPGIFPGYSNVYPPKIEKPEKINDYDSLEKRDQREHQKAIQGYFATKKRTSVKPGAIVGALEGLPAFEKRDFSHLEGIYTGGGWHTQ